MTTDCEERLEIVTTIERAEEIAGAWADLWQDTQALVFQNHAWIMGWWKGTAAEHRTLQIVLAWRGEKLDAVLPLVKQRNPNARRQAVTNLSELTALGESLRAAMLRQALKSYTG